MNEELLNIIYYASMEFGKDFGKPLIELIEELYPELPHEQKDALATSIEQTKRAVEQYFFDSYDTKNEEANQTLQERGKQWIKEQYPWMDEENVNRAAGQGMYFAWHG